MAGCRTLRGVDGRSDTAEDKTREPEGAAQGTTAEADERFSQLWAT